MHLMCHHHLGQGLLLFVPGRLRIKENSERIEAYKLDAQREAEERRMRNESDFQREQGLAEIDTFANSMVSKLRGAF